MTDEPDVTGSGEPTIDQRLGVLEDAVGLAHRHIGGLRYAVRSNEAQVILLGVGLILLAGAILLLSREVTVDVPGA